MSKFRCRIGNDPDDWQEIESFDAGEAAQEFAERYHQNDFECVLPSGRFSDPVEVEGRGKFYIWVEYSPYYTAVHVRSCRTCGCTEEDCRQCIQKTGEPCSWVEDDLCSACQEPQS